MHPLSMYARRVSQAARAPSLRPRQARTWTRHYASADNHNNANDDGQWFQRLRAEMLGRDIITSREVLSSTTSSKLIDTLESFLPAEWCPRLDPLRPHLDVGHHLIYFNPSMPADKLLPDGTDPLQDPGAPWVRRMWAGGSLQLRPELYYGKTHALTLDSRAMCAERIQDVQLRGQGDAAKIFVTIERRFTRASTILAKGNKGSKGVGSLLPHEARLKFAEQQQDGEEWGDAVFKEVRNLVFLKERTAAELDAITAGDMAPVRYLPAPTQPDFSHTLTPTRSLLFRFSALTWNAHLIHLDPHYARTVEGHRNMLVHGPLSLTIMLQAITNYIKIHTGGKQCFESIEYRNLAPLYCDEDMRVCGKMTKTSDSGNQYDIWIEGPTGGVAVKGTVNAAVRPSHTRVHGVAQKKKTRPGQDGQEAARVV